MSQWCHVAGGFVLSGSAFNVKKNKKGNWVFSMPFPEEQFKLIPPKPYNFKYKKEDGSESNRPGLEFGVYEYSLPRCKPIVEKLLAELPEGEHAIIPHSFYQDNYCGHLSSSCFDAPCEEKYFKEALTRYYHDDNIWRSTSYDILKKYFGARVNNVEHINDFNLSIFADLRYCDGEELMSKLETFIDKLYENKIHVDKANLAWVDEYNRYFTYSITNNLSGWSNVICFNLHDKKDNRIVASKIIKYKFDSKNYTYSREIIQDADFNTVIKDAYEKAQKEQNND